MGVSQLGFDHSHNSEAIFRRNKHLQGFVKRMANRHLSMAWEKWQQDADTARHQKRLLGTA